MIQVESQAKALLFDMDGTLIDTMSVHYKASQIICNELGFDFPIEYFYEKAGIPTIKVFEMLMEELNLPYDGKELGEKKEQKFVELLSEVKPLDMVADIAKAYYQKMPMAICTGGTKDIVQKTLEATDMAKYFNVIVTADDVTNPKPHPETFLKAAELLGINPADCQVFEDGEQGVIAGQRANMMVTDIRPYLDIPLG